jgi:MoaA/NifB/PqqE/SkfB family radical SAM enzyme
MEQEQNSLSQSINQRKTIGGIILNPGCSLSCVFCGGCKKPAESEMKEQSLKVYKNLEDLKEKGYKKITISGSDPIEYKYITELIRFIKEEEGFEWVQLSTHGGRLANSSFLKKLILSGIDELRIPIYGSTAKIHDSVTQKKGSFDDIITGIKNLLKETSRVNIQISSLILKENKNDLLNIVNLIDKLGIKNLYFSIPCLVNNLSQDYSSFYIPFKNLGPYLKKLYKYALKVNDKIFFLEIPFCVFGAFNPKNIKNTSLPPNLGKYCQPPNIYKTSISDLPSYRVKKKIKICNNCRASSHCDGFFSNDINRYGIGNLKSIR